MIGVILAQLREAITFVSMLKAALLLAIVLTPFAYRRLVIELKRRNIIDLGALL